MNYTQEEHDRAADRIMADLKAMEMPRKGTYFGEMDGGFGDDEDTVHRQVRLVKKGQ